MDINISNKQMADYLNMAMNLPAIKKMVSCVNASYVKLFNWFAKYYISTGDNSIEGVNKIIKLCKDYYIEGKISNPDNAYMEIILNKVLSDEKIINPTIIDKYNAVKKIELRNANNSFYTHCFPGALIENIRTEGLDSSKELFKNELSILEKYNKTSYKKGMICYTFLSELGLSYSATGVPERINYAIGMLKDRQEGETKKEQYTRSFLENIEKINISPEEKKELIEAGQKIIDFYCSDKRVGIALFKENTYGVSSKITFSTCLSNMDYSDKLILIQTILGEKIKKVFEELDSNPEIGLIHYNELMDETKANYPEEYIQICKFIDKAFYIYMETFAIKNYKTNVNADGYETTKIPPNVIELIITETPLDMYIDEEFIEKPKLMPAPKKENIFEKIKKKELFISNLVKRGKDFTRIDRIDELDMNICIGDNGIDFFDRYYVKSLNGGFFVADCSKYTLESKSKKLIFDRLMGITDEEEIKKIIEDYKQSEDYQYYIEANPKYFNLPTHDIKKYAYKWLSGKKYNELSDDNKASMIVESMRELGYSHVKITKDGYEVTRGKETKLYTPKTIIDKTNDAPLNSLYESMQKSISESYQK